jgi:hypothetical protein
MRGRLPHFLALLVKIVDFEKMPQRQASQGFELVNA